MSAEFLLIPPEDRNGVTTEAGDDIYAILATGAQTNGGYYLTHAIVPPGGGPPAHVHTREEEAFYIVRGELTFRADDRELTATAGSFVNVPRGTKHRFHNSGTEEVEMIFWFAPAGIEGLFEELIEHPENIVEIGQRYGTEYFFDD
jgi:mannose-6-phosphate isomerase-like protein (cupin superfamily)